MDDIIIKRTPVTPRVEFYFSKGKFLIEGVIDPQNSKSFFVPLLDKLKGFLMEDVDSSELLIAPLFVRTSSINYLKSLLEAFDRLGKHGQTVSVAWQCRREDEALQRLGDQLSKQTGVPIKQILT